MASLETKIRGIINKKKDTLKEDASGVVAVSQHVSPDWVDLGDAPTDPHGALPDYSKGITPGQAGLPGMNPTPGVGTVVGDGHQFTPQQEITEEEDDDDDRDDEKDQAGDDPDNPNKTMKEDNTADEENQRQYDKIKQGEKQHKLKEQALAECSCGSGNCAACTSRKDIKEDVEALFAGEKLTAAFKKKATAIFEAAVFARVNAIVEAEAARLVEEYAQEVEAIKTELTEKVDQYLDYVATEWLTENAIAIDSGIRNELVEDFLVGLKTLFAENYIDVPADKVDVVEALAEKVEQLEEDLNRQIATNVELKEANDSLVKYRLISESSKGLTEAATDKFIQLAEGIEFRDEESYSESLKVLKENQIVVKPRKSQNLTEEVGVQPIDPPAKPVTSDIKPVLDALKKTSR